MTCRDLVRVSRSWAMLVSSIVLILLGYSVNARKCPDCEAQYMICAWKCYESQGYRPTCTQRVSYMDGDAGPDPTDVEVYANPCDADCYAKAFEDFEFIEKLEPTYEQQPNKTCESAWRVKQALDYEFYSSGFLYEDLFPAQTELPQWLQDEIKALADSTIPVDETEIDIIRDECRTCNPSAASSSVAPLTTQGPGGAASISPEETPVAIAAPPVVETPLTTPPIVPAETPPIVPEETPPIVPEETAASAGMERPMMTVTINMLLLGLTYLV